MKGNTKKVEINEINNINYACVRVCEIERFIKLIIIGPVKYKNAITRYAKMCTDTNTKKILME